MFSAVRIRVFSLAAAKLWIGLILLVLLRTATAQVINFTLDFEEGDLRGWTTRDGAFLFQPTLDDNPTARGRGMPSNHQGRYWIGTYEKYQGRPGQRPGQIQTDEPQGELRSASFVCPGGTLSFLIGGGKQFETRVELRLEDQIEGAIRLYYATGSDNETMRRVTWNLDEFVGRSLHIRIVDNSSGGWGHINVDDFQFSALVRVPQLRERELDQAHGMIREAGLAIGPTNYMNVGERPDIVIRQTPAARQLVTRGTRVTLYVTRPTPEVPPVTVVPKVLGDDVRLARRKIGAAELSLGTVTREHSDQPTGIVIDQAPQADSQVPLDSPVDLTVSIGIPPVVDVEVPPLIGYPLPVAEEKIVAAELSLGTVTRQQSDQRVGIVIDQDPLADMRVPPESPVHLTVSAGMPPEADDEVPPLAVVPRVIGDDVRLAQRKIGAAGLSLGAVTRELSINTPGKVISQRPTAESEVPPGTSVDLAVAGWAVWGGAALIGGLAAAVAAISFWPPGSISLPGVTTEIRRDTGRVAELTHDGGPVKSDNHAQFVKDPGQQTVDIESNAVKSEQRNYDDD